MSDFYAKVRKEITNYRDGSVKLSDSQEFSQSLTVELISNLANQVYPTGKLDTQGNYKYWFDIIGPRINDETKNIDLDTRNIKLFSEMGNDRFRVFLANAKLREWMRDTKQGIKLNDWVEQSTGWGNLLFKKTKEGPKRLDLREVIITNQRAETLDDTDVIESKIVTRSMLQSKRGVYKDEALENVLESMAGKFVYHEPDDEADDSFEIFERNGEVTKRDFNELQGKDGGSDEDVVMAKVVFCLSDNAAETLYVGKIKSMADEYKEYHRGAYKGRWLREGFYEMLADIQIRCNELGNSIARAIEFAGTQFFTTEDRSVYRNVMTDLLQGDVINVKNLARVDTSMRDLNAHVAEWNQLMSIADRITNSMEIVSASDTPSSMPFRLGALLNENANKMYVFVREKLALTIKEIYGDWIVPDLFKNLNEEDVIRLTGDKDYLDEYRKMIVDSWYVANLAKLPPHDEEMAKLLKEAKLEEISDSKEEMVKVRKEYWKGFKARVDVNIVGEAFNPLGHAETLSSLLQLESDPIRRSFILESMWDKLGMDITKLPKPQPQPQQQARPAGIRPGQLTEAQEVQQT